MKTRDSSSNGFVLVWTAVLLVVLLLMAALAVDLGFWYRNKNQVQQAADAAAAAAVIYRTLNGVDDIDAATTAAQTAAVQNGFSATSLVVSKNDLSKAGQPLLPDNQIYVKVTKTSPNFFLGIIGMSANTVSAYSIAEYAAPLAIGSPTNGLGRQPGDDDWTAGTPGSNEKSQLWLDVHGPATATYNGDRYSTTNCAPIPGSSPSRRPDTCNNTTTNQDYTSSGYEYIVRVLPGGEGRPVTVQAYDPEFANTGTQCDNGPARNFYSTSNLYNSEANAAFLNYQTQITAIENAITQVEDRLQYLIGGLTVQYITTPGPGSELAKLRAGDYGDQNQAPVFGWTGSAFAWTYSSAWKRMTEIANNWETNNGAWGFALGGAVNAGLTNRNNEGTYFYDGIVNPFGNTLHGDWVPPLTNTTMNPLWSNQHDSAVDLIRLRSNLTAAKNGYPVVREPKLIDVSRYKAGPWSGPTANTDQQFCSGDTSFGAAYNDDGPGPTSICFGPWCGDNGLRMSKNKVLEPTARNAVRPTTQFTLLRPGNGTAASDQVCAPQTFGSFVERRDFLSEPTTTNTRNAEYFRSLSSNLDLRYVDGMNHNVLWFNPGWVGLITGLDRTTNYTFDLNWEAFGERSPNPQSDDGYGHTFLETFHQWYSLCTFTPSTPGDYRIRVTTSVGPDQNISVGANRFSLRAAQDVLSGPLDGNFVQVFGKDRMNLLLNFNDNTANAQDPILTQNQVFLTRVLPAGYDRELNLQFHDPGDLRICTSDRKLCAGTGSVVDDGTDSIDATGFTETMTLRQAGSTVPLPSCQVARGYQPVSWTTVSPCRILNLQAAGTAATNGGLVHVRIPLGGQSGPDPYSCTSALPSDLSCWIKASFTYSPLPSTANGQPTVLLAEDVTTWTVKVIGDPLRFTGN